MMKKMNALGIAGLLMASAVCATAGEWTSLLDKDLSQFEVFIGVPHISVTGLPAGTYQAEKVTKGQSLGLNNDPKHVFTMIEDEGEPVLKISGEIYGGVNTLKEYKNYHFSTLQKWGEKKWAPRATKLRDGGILYHCTDRHGFFWSTWKRCMEYQVQETDLGDLYVLGGTTGEVRASKRTYDPASEEFLAKGAIKAWPEPDMPHGEWNLLELYTVGDQAVHVVNGVVVMVIDKIKIGKRTLDHGQIQIQSEGAEHYYKQMKIQPITDFPPAIKAQMHLRGSAPAAK